MNRNKLDQIIADIRNEQIDDETVRIAAKRVFPKVFDAAFIPDRVERIRGCADFQTLIPAFLSHSLTAARLSLLRTILAIVSIAGRRCTRRAKQRRTVLTLRHPKMRTGRATECTGSNGLTWFGGPLRRL